MTVIEHTEELSNAAQPGRIWFIRRWGELTGENLAAYTVRARYTFNGAA